MHVPALAKGRAPPDPYVSAALRMCVFDGDEDNKEMAEMVWQGSGGHVGRELATPLLDTARRGRGQVQGMAA